MIPGATLLTSVMSDIRLPLAKPGTDQYFLHALRVAPQLFSSMQATGVTLKCVRLLCLEACSLAAGRITALTLELDGTTEAHFPMHLVESCRLQHLRLGVSVREHCSPGLAQAMASAAQLAPHLSAITRLTLQLRHHYPIGQRASTSRDKIPPTGALAATVLQCFTTICPLFSHLEVTNIHPEFSLNVLVAGLSTDPLVLPRITTLTLRLPGTVFPVHWSADEFAVLQLFSSLRHLDARGHRTPRAADWGVLFITLQSLELAQAASQPLLEGSCFPHLNTLRLHSTVSCTSLALLLQFMPALERVDVRELAIYVRPGSAENADAGHFTSLCQNPFSHLISSPSSASAMTSRLRFVSSTSAALIELLPSMPSMPCIKSCACHIDVPELQPGSPSPPSYLPHVLRLLPNLEHLSLHQCDSSTSAFEELEQFHTLRELEVSNSRSFTGAVAHKLITALPLLGSLKVSYNLNSVLLAPELQAYLDMLLLPRAESHKAWLHGSTEPV